MWNMLTKDCFNLLLHWFSFWLWNNWSLCFQIFFCETVKCELSNKNDDRVRYTFPRSSLEFLRLIPAIARAKRCGWFLNHAVPMLWPENTHLLHKGIQRTFSVAGRILYSWSPVGFDRTRKFVVICVYWNYIIQARKTWDKLHSDTSPNSEFSLEEVSV